MMNRQRNQSAAVRKVAREVPPKIRGPPINLPIANSPASFDRANVRKNPLEEHRSHPTIPINRVQPLNDQFNQANQNYQPAPLVYHQNQHLHQPFRCPRCMSQYIPRIERRISTAGWITFAVLLVFFFPLFWIGWLIKEDVRVCQSCNSKIG